VTIWFAASRCGAPDRHCLDHDYAASMVGARLDVTGGSGKLGLPSHRLCCSGLGASRAILLRLECLFVESEEFTLFLVVSAHLRWRFCAVGSRYCKAY
jgi:hypothetical protein